MKLTILSFLRFKWLMLFAATMFVSGCQKEKTATKILMQGNWELTEAKDEQGNDILKQISFPVTVIQLTDDNGMLGTHAPMATRIVYGDSKWAQVSGMMNQVFDYANFRFNTGEYFVGEGTATDFTVEFKLQATAIAGGLTDLLNIFGVGNGWLQQTVYHKFTNVKISFSGEDHKNKTAKEMIWQFDQETKAYYNYKDSQGNLIIWEGWPVNAFSKGRYVFTKRIEGLNDIVKAHL